MVVQHMQFTVGDIVQIVAIGVTATLFYLQLKHAQRERTEDAQRELAALNEANRRAHDDRKIQIYQTLEIESNTVFRFESEHKYVIPYFKANLIRCDLYELEIPDKDGTLVTQSEMHLIARKYYETTCNLFEVAARLRKHDIADPEVFGSWVAWYFDVLIEWGFRAAWLDLRDNYTRDLRKIFDPFVEELIADWDIPHDQGAFEDVDHDSNQAKGNTVSQARIYDVKRRFYQHVATIYGKGEPDPYQLAIQQEIGDATSYAQCLYVRDWLDQAEIGRPTSEHPQAYA